MENNEQNREQLAQQILDNTDLKTIKQFFYDSQIYELFELTHSEFTEQWKLFNP